VDAFRTDAERTLRRAAAEHFRRFGGPEGPAALEEIRRQLETGPDELPSLAAWVSIVEEAARHGPRLVRSLLDPPSAAPPEPFAGTALRLSRLAGTAAHVLEAGARTARERGAYSSSLMGCREVQESLAGLAVRAELARFGACRICRLVEKGEKARAVQESRRLEVLAGELAAEVRTVARSLLGEAWIQSHLDADGPPSAPERISR
jgi:hypothetical protein